MTFLLGFARDAHLIAKFQERGTPSIQKQSNTRQLAAQRRGVGEANSVHAQRSRSIDVGLQVVDINRLRRIDGPDPRDELARTARLTEAYVAAITARLARMDRASSRGPWTGAVLALIDERPAIVSTVLAEAMGWERQDFKLHVRRLKELGLTFSLDVGYRLSPRGEAYLNRLRN